MAVRHGSKRHALQGLPGVAIPGLTSFFGLVLIGRFAGPRVLGLVSLAWVTATFGSAVVALGPSQVAIRSVAMGASGVVPSLRSVALRRAGWVCPSVAVVGLALVAAGRDVGFALVLAAPWVLTQGLALFEIEVPKAERRFARSSAIASVRSLVGWSASVAGAAGGGTLLWCVLPHVASTALLVAFLRPVFTRSPDSAVVEDSRRIGVPIGRLAVASYSLGYADRYVINALVGPVAVGVYTLGYQLGEGALEVVSAPVTNALLPRVISEWSDPDKGRDVAFATVRRGAAVILGASVLAVPAVFTADVLGLLDLVSHSDDVAPVAALTAVAVGIQGVTRLAYGLLLAQGRPGAANRCFWQAVGLSVVVVPGLTLAWEIVGAALATLIGYGTLAVLMVRAASKGDGCTSPT